MYTKQDVINIIGAILQYPDEVVDAVTNENTEYGATELFDLATGGQHRSV